MTVGEAFDPACRRCPRLVAHREAVKRAHPGYHCAPVPSDGAPGARLLVVGLAPGLHGANATGRPFVGDSSGRLLFAALAAQGLSTATGDLRVTNAVRCLPPGNRPVAAELRACRGFLLRELGELPAGGAVLALGRQAHDSVVRAEGLPPRRTVFAHGAEHTLTRGRRLVDSYHCSRYNVNTGRLTETMFGDVVARAAAVAAAPTPDNL